MTRPDKYSVLEVVRGLPGNPSYVYRNVLHGKGFKGIRTDLVLSRLKTLQKDGLVKSKRWGGSGQYIWNPT